MSTAAHGVPRPRLRGALHAVAGFVTLPAGGWLVIRAPAGGARVATVAYALTMIGMFGASAVYHLGRWSAVWRRRLKAADHVAIFLFIAGSNGPLAAFALSGRAAALWLGLLWLGALVGCAVKLRALDRNGGLADVLYGVLSGWGVLVVPALATRMSGGQLGLLFAGLGCYGLAAGVLTSRRPDPWPETFGYHEVAHALITAAVVCHFTLYAWLFQ